MRTRDLEKEDLVKQKTIELIAENGFEGFSINKLAKACKISVATVYIYYKDKEDLINKIALERAQSMADAMLKDFNPESSLEEGIRQQWINRFEYIRRYPSDNKFYDQLRSSVYYEAFLKHMVTKISPVFGKFLTNLRERGEMEEMNLEVYWAITFGPLYSLAKFHTDGKSIGGRKFTLTKEDFNRAVQLVIKALKK